MKTKKIITLAILTALYVGSVRYDENSIYWKYQS